MGVVSGDAERELDHVQPADVDRTGGIEPGEDGGGDVGPVARASARPRTRRARPRGRTCPCAPSARRAAGPASPPFARDRSAASAAASAASGSSRATAFSAGRGPSSAASTACVASRLLTSPPAQPRGQLGEAPARAARRRHHRPRCVSARSSSATRKPAGSAPNGRSRVASRTARASSAAVSTALRRHRHARRGLELDLCSSFLPPAARNRAPLTSRHATLQARSGGGGHGELATAAQASDATPATSVWRCCRRSRRSCSGCRAGRSTTPTTCARAATSSRSAATRRPAPRSPAS